MTDAPLSHEPLVAPPIRPVGKRLLSTAVYVLLALAMLIVSPLAMFLPAALMHCGIRNGRRAAWAVLLLAGGLSLLLVVVATQAPQAPPQVIHDDLTALLGALLALGLPSVLALPLVERGERFGRVLVFALLVALGGVMATEVILQLATSFSPYAAEVTVMHEMGAKFVDVYTKANVPADAIRLVRIWTNLIIFVLPAVSLIYAAMVFIFSLVLLGRLPAWRQFAARRGLPSATGFLFRNLALPEWLLFAFIIGGVSPLLNGMPQRVGANILAVTAFLYFLQGLAVFRAFVAPAGGAFALFAWGTLGVLTITGVAPLLLAIAGLFDSFFDFRHFNRKDSSDESHSH